MPPEGIEIVQRSRLRENSGSMKFTETKEVSRRLPRELKFVRYIIRLEDLTKKIKMTSLCDVSVGVFQPDCMSSTFPKVKKSVNLERHPLSQKKKLFTSANTLLRLNCTKQILRWNHQANELQLPPSLKPVKVLSQMTPTWN